MDEKLEPVAEMLQCEAVGLATVSADNWKEERPQ